MKTKTLLPLVALVSVMFFASCKKDDPSPLSKDEATAKLTSINEDYNSALIELNATQGAQVNSTMGSLILPFDALPIKSIRTNSLVNDLSSLNSDPQLLKSKQLSDFIFANFVGTWDYYKTTHRFIQTTNIPNNQIILKFPHPYSNTTNNASITYYDYLSTTVLGSIKTTQIKADIKLGDSAVYTTVFTASYSSLTNTKYKLVNTYGNFVETTQYELNFSTSQIVLIISDELTKSGSTIYKTSSNSTFIYNNTSQSWATTISANIVVLSIEFRINLAFSSTDLTSPTYDPNNILKVTVYTTGGAKIGDIKKVKVNGDWVPYIFFTNGDSAPITSYGDRFNDINSFIAGLFDNRPTGK
jgi:hypothetical protein